jgi:hypothetical protein
MRQLDVREEAVGRTTATMDFAARVDELSTPFADAQPAFSNAVVA